MVLFCKPMPLPDTPVKQSSVALARVSGRNDSAHVDHISMPTKIQPGPREGYIFAVECQGEASVDDVPHWMLAFADQ